MKETAIATASNVVIRNLKLQDIKIEGENERPFGGKFIELSMGGENEKPNFSVAQHRKLLSLLQKPCTPLAEGNLPVHRILNSLHLNLSPSHFLIV